MSHQRFSFLVPLKMRTTRQSFVSFGQRFTALLSLVAALTVAAGSVGAAPLMVEGSLKKNAKNFHDMTIDFSNPVTILDQGPFAKAALSPGGTAVTLQGGNFTDFQALKMQFDAPIGTTFRVRNYSRKYIGNQSIIEKFQHARDPLSSMVLEGGSNGSSFLGYDIPAGSYGYFYQAWAGLLNGQPLTMDRLVINNLSAAPPTNLQVIGASVDTGLLESDAAETDGLGNLLFGGSMLDDAVIGAGIAPVSWVFDVGLGALVADFAFGLTGMAGSQILAFTSTSAPFINDTFGDVFDPMAAREVMVPIDDLSDTLSESFYWSGVTADEQLFFYKRVPEPSTLLLLAAAGFACSRRCGLRKQDNRR